MNVTSFTSLKEMADFTKMVNMFVNLYLIIKDNMVYLFDSYFLGDENYDYGIFGSVSLDDLKAGTVTIKSFPSRYLNPIFDVITSESRDNAYQLPVDLRSKLDSRAYYKYADTLKEAGIPVTKDFENLCKLVGGQSNFAPVTDSEIQQIIAESEGCTAEMEYIEMFRQNAA